MAGKNTQITVAVISLLGVLGGLRSLQIGIPSFLLKKMNYSPLPSLVLNLVLTLAANLKKPANRAKAQAKRAEGYIVCGEFGLSKGENGRIN